MLTLLLKRHYFYIFNNHTYKSMIDFGIFLSFFHNKHNGKVKLCLEVKKEDRNK